MWKDPVTGELQQGIKKVSYTHEAMANIILGNPCVQQYELAQHFGVTEGWISQVIGSDAFQAFIATRREEIIDPILRGAVEESFKGLVLQSVQRLREKLAANPSDQLVLQTFQSASRALGYGSRIEVNAKVQHSHSLIGVLSSLPPAARLKDVNPVPLLPAAA